MEGELTTKFHRKQKEMTSNGVDKIMSRDMAVPPKRKFKWGAGLDEPVDLTGKFILETSPLPESCTNPNIEGSEIQEFFKDANVFITGATGFMGKTLIEKLLVSCPKIANLYVLIREKRGKNTQERFNELFGNPVFNRLHKLVPKFRSKIVAFNGDCSKSRLGLSDTDYEFLTKNTTIIFNGAATVRFDEKLKQTVNINVRSVKEMMQFAHDCPSLKSIVHVSTAYANCHILDGTIHEEFYPPPMDYNKLLDLVDIAPDEALEQMTPTLINPWPNTYTFSKQVGESIVEKEGKGLPLAIFRPAIVIATYKEPIRAWTDNIYGPTGIIVGAGTGVLRVVQCDVKHVANLVPVDLTTNGVIASAWKAAVNFQNGIKEPVIYNHISSTRNPVTWGEFIHWNGLYGQNWPTTRAIWYSCFNQCKSTAMYLFYSFFLHTLPALLADGVLIAMRKKPLLTKAYKKIHKFNDIISYFSKYEFHFADDNTHALWKSLSAKDKEIFPFDVEELDWDFFAQGHLLGLRWHLANDPIDTLSEGRKKWQRLHILHRIVQFLLVVFIFWIISETYYLLW